MTPALYLALRFSLRGVGSSARLFYTLDGAAVVLRAVPKKAHLKQCAGSRRSTVARIRCQLCEHVANHHVRYRWVAERAHYSP
ncbi:MAG: hypothetical protein WBY94_00830, partial [Polyangiaceae bacterium]